jgi:hypothetical protein
MSITNHAHDPKSFTGDALALGVLLTFGLDDRVVHLLIELWSDTGTTFDRQVARVRAATEGA